MKRDEYIGEMFPDFSKSTVAHSNRCLLGMDATFVGPSDGKYSPFGQIRLKPTFEICSKYRHVYKTT